MKTPAFYLFREYLASNFLKIWEIPTPDFAIVHVSDHHLDASLGIGTTKLPIPCFGTLFLKNVVEPNNFIKNSSAYERRKYLQTENFLAIAFFDIWISNEDRHENNYNLLIQADNKFNLFAIDHGECLHSGSFQEIYPINEDESLLSSQAFRVFCNSGVPQLKYFINELLQKWYVCISECNKKLEQIVYSVPDEWGLNKKEELERLTTFLFSEGWYDKCKITFGEILQRAINRKH